MNNFTTSPAGLALVKTSEELRLLAYLDCDGVWTIGWGHTGPDVHPGLRITEAEAEDLLRADLRVPERIVNTAAKVALNQHQFDALVDFVFNEGAGRFLGSTLLRVLNQGKFAAAADELLKWEYGGNRILKGLATRRQAERTLFLQAAAEDVCVFRMSALESAWMHTVARFQMFAGLS